MFNLKYFTAAIVFLFTTVIASYAISAPSPEIIKMNEEMLETVVQIRSDKARGSGTVIYSGVKDFKAATYVLTNNHVIDNAFVKRTYKDKDGKDVEVLDKKRVQVVFYTYNNYSTSTGETIMEADIVARDETRDLALLKLVDTERAATNVAKIDLGEIYMGETVYAVGSGDGEPPFMTQGLLGYMNKVFDGFEYVMATAPITWGNSGGALFHKVDNSYKLIGVPARTTIVGGRFVVPHMGYAIKMQTVVDFLKETGNEGILE